MFISECLGACHETYNDLLFPPGGLIVLQSYLLFFTMNATTILTLVHSMAALPCSVRHYGQGAPLMTTNAKLVLSNSRGASTPPPGWSSFCLFLAGTRNIPCSFCARRTGLIVFTIRYSPFGICERSVGWGSKQVFYWFLTSFPWSEKGKTYVTVFHYGMNWPRTPESWVDW